VPTMAAVSVSERGRRQKIQRQPNQRENDHCFSERARTLPMSWLVHGTVKGPVVVLLCPLDEQVTVYVPVPLPVFDTVWYVQLMFPLPSAR
jgi:hypothetical protein